MSDLKNNPLILAYVQQNNFGRLLGMNFSLLSPGIVEYKLQINNSHLATPLAAHGGVLSSLLDATVGVGALSTVCEEEKVVSTIELSVTYLAPAFLNDQLVAYSDVVKKGHRLIFMEAKIENQNGVLLAKATSILNSYPKEKAGY
ncbi:MAG: hypothetical protein RI883_304 [Bacteroidota bacterium]|jgi:acyl-CoA thioesterase